MRKLIPTCFVGILLCFFSCKKQDIVTPPALITHQVYGFSDFYNKIDTSDNLVFATHQFLSIGFLSGDTTIWGGEGKQQYQWTLSDGRVSNDIYPNFQMNEAGKYQLKLDIKNASGQLIYTGDKNIQVVERQFKEITVENWNWSALGIWDHSLKWDNSKTADVYFIVKKCSISAIYQEQLGDYEGEIIYKSQVLKNVSPEKNKTLTFPNANKDRTAFPFNYLYNADPAHEYAYELIAIDQDGKSHLWQTNMGSGVATGPHSDLHYAYGKLIDGQINFGIWGKVRIYFAPNTPL